MFCVRPQKHTPSSRERRKLYHFLHPHVKQNRRFYPKKCLFTPPTPLPLSRFEPFQPLPPFFILNFQPLQAPPNILFQLINFLLNLTPMRAKCFGLFSNQTFRVFHVRLYLFSVFSGKKPNPPQISIPSSRGASERVSGSPLPSSELNSEMGNCRD